MKSIFFLLFITCGSSFCENKKIPDKYPISEGEYAKIEDVPYQASIIHLGVKVYCGATIIHKYWVVTASHCIQESMINDSVIRTGTDELLGAGVRHDIDYVVKHPQFNPKNYDNDIALIKLKTPIIFNKNQTSIPFSKPSNVSQEGQFMLISGFGRIGTNQEQPKTLKKGYVPITKQKVCKKLYKKNPITDNMFCAGVGIVDACDGDSGGPGVINGNLYGIISSGGFCPSLWAPGTYTKADLYNNWVTETIGIKL